MAQPPQQPQQQQEEPKFIGFYEDSEADLRAKVVAEAESWLRTPYVNGGAIKGAGVDCGMFLIMVYSNAGLIPFVDPRPYPEQHHMHSDEERYMGTVLKFGREIDGPPLPGDVVMFKFGRCYSHGGIVTRWPKMIHAMRPGGVTVENVERCTFGERALAGLPRKYFSYW